MGKRGKIVSDEKKKEVLKLSARYGLNYLASHFELSKSEIYKILRQERGKPAHFAELSKALLTIATNFETHLRDIGPLLEKIGDFVYGGDDNIRYGMGMRKVDKFTALNVLHHLKGEFPELSEVKDWADLVPGDTMNDDLILRLQLKAQGGQFSGKCPACPR
jgi:hypothetical protein